MTSDSAEIRAGLGHPVIDIDGHTTESLVALEPYLRDEGVDPASDSLRRLLPGSFGPWASWYEASAGERADRRIARPPWWGGPARNTRDLATALCPKLMYERLDEFGIDVSVTYPSLGLIFMHLDDERERRGTCRALNRCNAEAFAPLTDRLVPVAAIPMHTPDEACEELDYAVNTLGFKAVLLAGYVQRPVAAVADRDPELAKYAQWIDMYGIDSAYDYDPVWQQCLDLGVGVSFHSGSIGWGSRMSISNYMYNHLGHLAEGHHALAKSLFMGGVTRRFPDLPFAFLEGGVAWAVALYADLDRSLGEAQHRRHRPPQPRAPRPRAARVAPRAVREQSRYQSGVAPGGPPPGGPGDTRRVGAVRDRDQGGLPRPVRAQLLLRLRGRRPADGRRLQCED